MPSTQPYTLTTDPALVNLFGPLDAKSRARLRRCLDNPTRYWDDAHCMIVGAGFVTLWQAVLVVDPTFLRSKSLGKPWPRVPDSFTIARAIRYAAKAK